MRFLLNIGWNLDANIFTGVNQGGSVALVLPDAQKCTLVLISAPATITRGQYVGYTSCRKHGIVSSAVKFVVSTQIVVSVQVVAVGLRRAVNLKAPIRFPFIS